MAQGAVYNKYEFKMSRHTLDSHHDIPTEKHWSR